MALDYKLLSDPDYRANYEQRRKELEEKIEKEEADFAKRLQDCNNSPRLTDWERSFITSLLTGFKTNIATRFDDLSERQQAVLKKIERKVHAAG